MPKSTGEGLLPEEWTASSTVRQLCGEMLENPSGDFAAAVAEVLPDGILRAAHAYGLYRQLGELPRLATCCTSNKAIALHVWLFHFGGGSSTKLCPPPVRSSDAAYKLSTKMLVLLERECTTFFKRRGRVGADSEELAPMRNAPFNLAPLMRNGDAQRAQGASAAGGGGDDDGPQPSIEVMLDRRDRRKQISLLLLAAASERLGNHSPFVTLANFTTDILRYIVDLSLSDHPQWIPRLRKVAWQLERELHVTRALVEELQLTCSEAVCHSRRALERETAAIAALDTARELHKQKLEEKDEEIEKVKKAAASELRKLKKEMKDDAVEWQLEVNHTENTYVKLLREQDADHRRIQCDYAAKRDEAEDNAVQLERRIGELNTLIASRRSIRVDGLLEERDGLLAQVKQLSERRKANQLTIKEANLYKHAMKQSTEAKQKQQSRLNKFWASERDAERELEKVKEKLAFVEQQCEEQRRQLEQQAEEIKRLKSIAEPGKEWFKTGNHFCAEVDLSVVQLLSLGIARKKLPKLYPIFARLYRITLPARRMNVPGRFADGKRTYVERLVPHTPGATHCKEMAGVMYQINKLVQVGKWLLEYMNSDETSCCYLADGAEAQQLERLGQILSRRVDGKLQLMALDCNTVDTKTGEAQAAAYKQSIEEAIQLMEKAGMVDERAAELLRRFMPTCSCKYDRAANGRKGARLVLGLADGDDDPTCAEHALVNVLEEGRKAMDAVLREMMQISDEQAEGDASKIKAMRTCVGWFSSPVCALIYQVAKYVALCSTKGYAIGRKFLEWMEARLADVDDQAVLLGHSEDVLAICGSRMYIFSLDAAPTERLLSQEGSLLTYLQEEADMGAENGGKLRASILKGASSTCMAGVRAMAIICDVVFWEMIRAVKPGPEVHVLDVLPRVWPAVHTFFERAAASPSEVVDGARRMDLGCGPPVMSTATTPTAAKRSARAQIDMARIRQKAKGDQTVERLLVAAFQAMAKAVANHAAEWLPAGLTATDGSITKEGKLSAARITPTLRAKYDAFCATSTPVERLHALGRCVDDRGKRQRTETRAGIQLGIFNGQAADLAGMETEELIKTFNVCRPAARKARRITIKQQLMQSGRAKRAERDAKLSSKRAKRAARESEAARIQQVQLASRYSELKQMAIPELQDQLKAFKLQGKTKLKFTTTQKNRVAYCTLLQTILLEVHGTAANDLNGDDSGCDGDGVVRKVRKREGSNANGRKRKGGAGWNEIAGYWWQDDEEFDIERLLDKKVELVTIKRGNKKSTKEVVYYKVLWSTFPPEAATWEPESAIHDDFIDEYEAELEAEAELHEEELCEEEEEHVEEE